MVTTPPDTSPRAAIGGRCAAGYSYAVECVIMV